MAFVLATLSVQQRVTHLHTLHPTPPTISKQVGAWQWKWMAAMYRSSPPGVTTPQISCVHSSGGVPGGHFGTSYSALPPAAPMPQHERGWVMMWWSGSYSWK